MIILARYTVYKNFDRNDFKINVNLMQLVTCQFNDIIN